MLSAFAPRMYYYDSTHIPTSIRLFSFNDGNSNSEDSITGSSGTAQDEARRFMEQARKIRESIPDSIDKDTALSSTPPENQDDKAIWYRFYVNIGRENGTWMEPRWGASGSRIEFIVDVGFTVVLASEDVQNRMIRDNLSGKSSQVMTVLIAPKARLRGGFDSMKCFGGGYRIDGKTTVRMFFSCSGTPENEYGDIFIPPGELYFSIPCFMDNVRNLSQKEVPVTVRQKGWHTGWFR